MKKIYIINKKFITKRYEIRKKMAFDRHPDNETGGDKGFTHFITAGLWPGNNVR